MPINQKGFTYDNALLLKDATAITASAAAQVGGSNRILDLGAGRVDARLVVDVSAIKTSANDESYRLRLQLSNSSSFASGVFCPVSIELGDSTVTGNSADTAVGRYEAGFSNEVNGTVYRYARLNQVIAGTSPTYTASAYIVKEA